MDQVLTLQRIYIYIYMYACMSFVCAHAPPPLCLLSVHSCSIYRLALRSEVACHLVRPSDRLRTSRQAADVALFGCLFLLKTLSLSPISRCLLLLLLMSSLFACIPTFRSYLAPSLSGSFSQPQTPCRQLIFFLNVGHKEEFLVGKPDSPY